MLNLIVAAFSFLLPNFLLPHVRDPAHPRVFRSAPLCMNSDWSSFDEVTHADMRMLHRKALTLRTRRLACC